MTSDEAYKTLAAELGDITFKISLLEAHKYKLMEAIKKLTKAAHEQKKAQEAEPEGVADWGS